jgi:talin
VAQNVAALTDGTCCATYLIGIADPDSTPYIPSVIDQNVFTQAGLEIQDACKKLVEAKLTQSDILDLAAIIAKQTSRLCNSCKVSFYFAVI